MWFINYDYKTRIYSVTNPFISVYMVFVCVVFVRVVFVCVVFVCVVFVCVVFIHIQPSIFFLCITQAIYALH